MKIPVSWINEYVDISDIEIDALRSRLDLAGLELDGVDIIGHPGSELPWAPDKVLTAEVLSVNPHPDADRLVLVEVNYGGEVNEIVVTGAPSLYAHKGESDLHYKVAFAWEGAVLYDGHKEGFSKRKLKKSKIRGVPSRAMVCSEKELGLSEAQEDIIYLPDDTPVGLPLTNVLGDYILSFDIKGPFGHLQSVYGIARDIAAVYNRPVNTSPMQAAERLGLTYAEKSDFIKLEIPAPDLCPRFTGTMIRGIEIKPSPTWMQMRLNLIGMRPINNIVDITNYVMWELGQPLHAYDYQTLNAKPGEDKPAIIVRRAVEGEQMATLDGEMRTYDSEMCMITDGAGPIGVGGVMGGLNTEIEDTTEDIMLEAASFNFINIRRTAQRLKLSTDAASHYGKRIDSDLAAAASARAVELMAQLAGGTVDTAVADLHPGKPETQKVNYDTALADRLLGIEIPAEQQKRILETLEFIVDDSEDDWKVTIPAYRLDVTRAVDLVEEVARIYGYDRFPGTLIDDEVPPLRRNIPLEEEERVRDLLTGLGLDEIISYSLIDPLDEGRLHPVDGQSLSLPGDTVTLRNYLAPERAQMRRTLLPGALRTAWSNLRYLDRINIFEIGRVHYAMRGANPASGDTGVDEPRHLSMLMSGVRDPRWWQDPSSNREELDYFDLKGVVENLLGRLALMDLATWRRSKHASFHPGRCAEVLVGDTVLGTLGELHPVVRDAFDLPKQPVVVLEWDLEATLDTAREAEKAKQISLISAFAPVHEDLAVVVDEAVPTLDVQRAIINGGRPLVTRAVLFDVYRGEQVPEGKKSLAYALSYQSPSRSLNERDVEKLRKRIIKTLKRNLDATIRGA